MTPIGGAAALIRLLRRLAPVLALTTLALLPLAPGTAAGGVVDANANADANADANAEADAPPSTTSGMNETVVTIPGDDPAAAAMLETTLFTPDGNGPFPVVIFNHGKERGDPHRQPRSRPLAFAREFVRRGYMVVAPNRRGFARSGGTYAEQRCAIDANGLEQAADIAATVRYVQRLPNADATRIVIAGASQGGLATLAYGVQPGAGVRGLINFVGGLRQDGCVSWQQSMIDAFRDYGRRSRLPTLWFYGDNDLLWPQALAQRLLTVYREGGGLATMMDFGDYKDNAHRLVGDRDAVPVWWPAVENFLVALRLPVAARYPVMQTLRPAATGFASIDAVAAVPYLDDSGREGYATFLRQYPTRAFALSASGAWSWAEGGDDPAAVALDSCQRNSREPCRLYAIDSDVVWNER
ncbi:MAG: dienelactone hydrolase family protein [Janthinobacterium lividum]